MIIESTNPLPIIRFDISESDMIFEYYCVRCEKIGDGVITRKWDYPSPHPPTYLEGVEWCLTLAPTTPTLGSSLQSNGCTCTAPRDIPFDVKGNVVGYYVKSVEEPPPSYNS